MVSEGKPKPDRGELLLLVHVAVIILAIVIAVQVLA